MTNQSGSVASGTAGGVLSGAYPNPSFATNGTTPILGAISVALTADVPLPTPNTYVDALTLAVTPGSWLVFAMCGVRNTVALDDFTARLWDGTTIISEASLREATATIPYTLNLFGIYVTAAPATLRLSVATDADVGTITATLRNNATANKATFLTALRIA